MKMDSQEKFIVPTFATWADFQTPDHIFELLANSLASEFNI